MPSNGLGRGLGSLIPQKVNKVATTSSGDAVLDIASESDKNKILQLEIGKIKVNSLQPRSDFNETQLNELVESIKQYGIIQPLIVHNKNGQYELIAGERRLRAAKIIGLEKVPAIVRDVDEQEKLEVALIENLQRENLNSIETALAYRKLIDEFNLTQEEVGIRVGKSRSSITNILRLLNLPEEIQQGLKDGRINEGHAKLISGLEGEDKQMALYRKIMRNNLTVDGAITESRQMGGTKHARIKINYKDKDKEFAFREFFGSRIEVKRKGRGGEIKIYFSDDDELSEIVSKVRK